ncbi:hypothetical protein J5226_12945 [Lysobacter sp. K5869]|uniref:D-Ala-D-Ala carboxypeptidase family metallohydrolase n=1 Tax=Lysobacter sp. K5869 TaxID=2820808 RepID=UPI001C0634E2|nr:D-Ala-D-Ala carboxypeptidase family metallohydrolase [Lysobacter sp. K5869]QWP79232.1 hypothetical protein J5226_12945 [Lysobacter sp. K5869]
MAQLLLPDIPGAMQQGWEFGTRQRLQREGEQRQNQLNALSQQTFQAAPEARNALLGQMEAVQAGAGVQYGQQLGQQEAFDEERRNKTLFNMARVLVNSPQQARAGLYQQMVPTMRRFGMTDAPPAYTPETASLIDQTAQALVQASLGAQGTPTGFRELDMTARAAGYAPGTAEYQQAAQVALGMRGRAATGGFGFELMKGPDGRERMVRKNPRTGAVEVYDEATGDFAPLGAAGALNPGQAPAAGGAGAASNLSTPIAMPADMGQAFAALGSAFPGTRITSTTRSPQHNREVGGVPNSQHLSGTAADFVVDGSQKAAFIAEARRQGFEAIDEGDHVHLELPPRAAAARASGRPELGVGQSPAERTYAEQAGRNAADLANYDAMTEKVTRREAATAGAQATAKNQAERANAQQDRSAALRMYETAVQGLREGLSGTETGPLLGRLPAVTTGQQTAEGAVAAMAPILKQLFRSAGEGAFTDKDQDLLLKMVPTRTDTPQARANKLANIDRIVRAKLSAAPTAAAAAPARASGGAAAGGGVDDLLSKYGVR